MASRWRVLGPALAVTVAAGTAIALGATSGDDDPAAPTTTAAPAPVEVTSDAPRHATLEDLVAAADLVVRARVTQTERGRVFGDPAEGSAIESRLVRVEVTATFHGAAPGPGLL